MHISFYILYIICILYVYYTLVFDNFILSDEPFVKALQNLKNSVLVNENLWGKLFSSLESPTTFEEIFKVTSVPFFFQILIYEVAN